MHLFTKLLRSWALNAPLLSNSLLLAQTWLCSVVSWRVLILPWWCGCIHWRSRALRASLVVWLYTSETLAYWFRIVAFEWFKLTHSLLTFCPCDLGVKLCGFASYLVSELRFLLGLDSKPKHTPKPNTFPTTKNPPISTVHPDFNRAQQWAQAWLWKSILRLSWRVASTCKLKMKRWLSKMTT